MGGDHSCALLSSGDAFCWGGNEYGQVRVRVAACAPVTLALNFSLTMCFFVDVPFHRRQLGDGTTFTRLTPVLVVGVGASVAVIRTGYWHTCVVLSTGAALCFGLNTNGQLGVHLIP